MTSARLSLFVSALAAAFFAGCATTSEVAEQ